MMNDTSSEDPWASLAEELGVAEPVHHPATPKHHHEHKPASVRPKAAAHAHAEAEAESKVHGTMEAPEVLEAPEPLDGSEDAEGDEPSDSPTGETVEGGPDGGKKRRRRRRRGKKKPDEAGTAAAGEVVASSEAPDTILDVEESAEEGDFEAELPEREESEPEHLAVALDEEMEADNSHENTVWKVTSWKELVAGLHRPER